MNFEYECPKEMYERINDDGLSMVEYLAQIERNSNIRDLHLVTPLTLSRGRSSTGN